jgi:hypothetical protein
MLLKPDGWHGSLITNTVRQRKRAVGAIAITLLLLFTVLAILGYISFIIWVSADLVVALIANVLFKRIGR